MNGISSLTDLCDNLRANCQISSPSSSTESSHLQNLLRFSHRHGRRSLACARLHLGEGRGLRLTVLAGKSGAWGTQGTKQLGCGIRWPPRAGAMKMSRAHGPTRVERKRSAARSPAQFIRGGRRRGVLARSDAPSRGPIAGAGRAQTQRRTFSIPIYSGWPPLRCPRARGTTFTGTDRLYFPAFSGGNPLNFRGNSHGSRIRTDYL